MSNSYCLKSCETCGKCAGCRGSEHAARCDIAKCCREKSHDTCETCTRFSFCPTQRGRDDMPQKFHDQDRREEERRAQYRANAAVMAKWTWIIFWCSIAGIVLNLVDKFVPLYWVSLGRQVALLVAVAYCFLQMKEVCWDFRTNAILYAIYQGVSILPDALLPDGGLKSFLGIVMLIVSVVAIRIEYLAFRDSLSGIDRDMSEKWGNQWNLYKIAILITNGGAISSFILSYLGVFVAIGGIILLVIVSIRQFVYLYQTVQTCRRFAETG